VSFANCKGQIDEYLDALVTEIDAFDGENYVVDTLFVGGGTPSLLSVTQLSKVFDVLKRKFVFADNAEITIESNPNSLTAEKLKHYLFLGVNRLSIGVQSLDDETLRILGRIHTSSQARKAIGSAVAAGFTNINIDLIHSVPSRNRGASTLQGDLDALLSEFPQITHVSVYSLIVEPETPIEKRIGRGELIEPTEDESIAQQQEIEGILARHGFNKYEVSNFARSGSCCRHNKTYWNPTQEYLGFGLAAHSMINNARFANTEDLSEYLRGVTLTHDKPVLRTKTDLVTEIIMLGLRKTSGISVAELCALGYDIRAVKESEIKDLLSLDLIKIDDDRISATDKGFLLLNKVIERLSPDEE
jgi:oxygen-independent coproporphyrinogen-3 oxidase